MSQKTEPAQRLAGGVCLSENADRRFKISVDQRLSSFHVFNHHTNAMLT